MPPYGTMCTHTYREKSSASLTLCTTAHPPRGTNPPTTPPHSIHWLQPPSNHHSFIPSRQCRTHRIIRGIYVYILQPPPLLLYHQIIIIKRDQTPPPHQHKRGRKRATNQPYQNRRHTAHNHTKILLMTQKASHHSVYQTVRSCALSVCLGYR